jgi:beta-lactamase class A
MRRKLKIGAVCGAVTMILATGFFSRSGEAGTDRKRKQSWSLLQARIQRQYARFRGSAGIVVRDMSTGWEISINKSSELPAASLVKIPIMAGCFKAVEEGRISLQDRLMLEPEDKTSGSGVLKAKPSGSLYTVNQLIELMIAESDNTATNILIDKLGVDYLNAFFRRQGLKATSLRRKMMDFSKRKQGVENYTSAGDIALLLDRMYRRACPGAEKCMETLLKQKLRDRIPKKLPKDTPVAHKTGLERNVCHDAGIVFAPEGDFMICVLTKSKAGPYVMKDFIAKVARLVYDAYESPHHAAAKEAKHVRSR